MNPTLFRLALVFVGIGALLAVGRARAATDVGVSIGIQQPGLYGRIEIGNLPPPPVIVPNPVVIVPGPVARPPMYLYVPPGHQKDWRKHCARYDACGVPVYFVQERWVREHEPERFKKGKHKDKDDGHPGKGHGKGRD